jgi:hypothetical protein
MNYNLKTHVISYNIKNLNWKLLIIVIIFQLATQNNLCAQDTDIYEYQEKNSSQIFWTRGKLPSKGKIY